MPKKGFVEGMLETVGLDDDKKSNKSRGRKGGRASTKRKSSKKTKK